MTWIRFGTGRGINLDECTEWTYEDKPVAEKVVIPVASAARGATSTPSTPSAEAAKPSPSPTVGAAGSPSVASGETVPEPPVTIPTLTLRMGDGREVVLEGDDATKTLAYFVGTTGAL